MYYLGQICLFPYDYVPEHFVECDGAIWTLLSHEALFSLLGTRFGGDGEIMFRLPDLRNLAPHGMKYCICVDGQYPPRT